MSEYKPFTDATRQAFREWAETAMVSRPPQSEIDQAVAYLRFEATLQTKDAQIEALVGLVQELRDCVMDDGLPCNCGTLKDGSQYECIQCRSYTAIKEDMGL